MSKNINDNGTNEFNFTGTDFIDSILQSEKKRWTLLPGNVITYSFINPESELLYPDEFKSVTSLNSIIQGYFTDILKNVIGSVISVDFTFKPERVSKNEDGVSLETTDFGTLRIMGKKFNDSSTLGMGKFPGSELSAGDLYQYSGHF